MRRVRRAEPREDAAADPAIGISHMRPLLCSRKGESDPAERVGSGRGPGASTPVPAAATRLRGTSPRHTRSAPTRIREESVDACKTYDGGGFADRGGGGDGAAGGGGADQR